MRRARVLGRLRRRRQDQRGYAAILVAMFAGVLMVPLCAISVDTSRWYVEVQRVQNAADAAAMAGVTYLPDDFTSAKSTAVTVSGRNGYPDSGTSAVAVSLGDKPTQLTVTVSSTIGNAFGSGFGIRSNTITRSATADFNGPAPMGSPCNTFGNEPPGAGTDDGDPVRGPDTSVIVAPPGGASCTSNPQLWGAVAGPNTDKYSGDEFMTRNCNTAGTAGCTGTTNDEFDPQGYFYIVRVGTAAVGTPVTLQIYDPAWVENGDTCNVAPNGTMKDAMNPYTPSDGTTRYLKTPSGGSPNSFCTGDTNATQGSSPGITTSYGLRMPTDSYNPKVAVPINSCEKQYPPYVASTTDSISNKSLDSTLSATYNKALAQVYHQWVKLCTFTPSVAGDYYLQIRTNVKIPGTASADGEGGFTNNPAVFNQTGDDTSVGGAGNNRFSMRVTGAQRGAVSIAGYQAMSIYANYSGANTTFNLVRVIPAAASKTLNIGFFDVGDVASGTSGTVTVLPPSDSNLGANVSTCTGAGPITGAISGCKLTNVNNSSTWNGKYENLKIPIPSNYTCNVGQAGGCWWRLLVSFPGGVSDTTTWTASVDGDPIRLIK